MRRDRAGGAYAARAAARMTSSGAGGTGPARERERALAHEDLEAVDGRGAGVARGADERGLAVAVDEVDDDRPGDALHRARVGVVEADGGAVDEQVGGLLRVGGADAELLGERASRARGVRLWTRDLACRPASAPTPRRGRCRRRRARGRCGAAGRAARRGGRGRRCCRPRCGRRLNVSVLAAPIARGRVGGVGGQRQRGLLVRDGHVGADEAGLRQRAHGLGEQVRRHRQALVGASRSGRARRSRFLHRRRARSARPASRGRRAARAYGHLVGERPPASPRAAL